MILAHEPDRGGDGGGDPGGRVVAGDLFPEADADQPAARRDLLHQRVGKVPLRRALAVDAAMADHHRHVDHVQHVARHLRRGMGEVDDHLLLDHLADHQTAEIRQPLRRARLPVE